MISLAQFRKKHLKPWCKPNQHVFLFLSEGMGDFEYEEGHEVANSFL